MKIYTTNTVPLRANQGFTFLSRPQCNVVGQQYIARLLDANAARCKFYALLPKLYYHGPCVEGLSGPSLTKGSQEQGIVYGKEGTAFSQHMVSFAFDRDGDKLKNSIRETESEPVKSTIFDPS